jgi:succinate-semialdehyde dehydrogenase / glutarate-semialdehyde dehydrogenase
MRSVDPASGRVLAEYPEHTAAELERALDACQRAFSSWRGVDIGRRAGPMRELARLLRAERDRLAALATREMGKVIRESRAEVEKCAWACEHYAEHAAAYLAPESVATEAASSRVVYTALGPILAVMPWNFPYWQVFRFAAPALMAGNGVLLKHASNVTGCALAVEELVARAGFPEGIFRTLLVSSREVPLIIGDRRIVGVTLTGSEAAGAAVAEAAGKHVKKSVLELGGSDPYLVLEDADLDLAARSCVTGRLLNGGQSCIAAKRFVVVEAVLPAFERLVVAAMAAVRQGDPFDEATGIGPLARTDLRDEVHGQVERSVAAGARLLLGGRVPSGPGAFYPPTVLGGVRPGMPAFDEEVFGPVAALIAARDEEEAIRLANESRFGLGAAVFTRDTARGERIAADRLEAGCCFVNTHVRSDPRLPFGGVKASGYGRELGAHGIREWVNAKTVYVA